MDRHIKTMTNVIITLTETNKKLHLAVLNIYSGFVVGFEWNGSAHKFYDYEVWEVAKA